MILTEFLKDLLFPRKCVFCGQVLSMDETDLCHECRDAAPEYDGSGKMPRNISGVSAVWFYEGTVRESLLRFKFHNKPGYAKAYGPMLALRVARELPGVDVITWVPVSAERRNERGYDQSELLAKAVSKELGIPAKPSLKKIRHNPAQSGIADAEARRANVADAYIVRDASAVKGRKVLLIDDILTTGATAGECARMLIEAGAATVFLGTVAAGRRYKKEEVSCQ